MRSHPSLIRGVHALAALAALAALSAPALAQTTNILTRFPVLVVPGMEEAVLRPDLVFKTVEGLDLKFDLHLPPGADPASPPPVVVIVNGFAPPDGAPPVRKWGQHAGWARLATTLGFAAVTHDNRRDNSPDDISDLLAHLKARGSALGVDGGRICLFSFGAHVNAAARLLAMDDRKDIRAAVMYIEGHLRPGVVEDLPVRLDMPTLIVMLGYESPERTAEVAGHVALAASRNAPITFVNAAGGTRRLDTSDDNDYARSILRGTLDFIAANLAGPARDAFEATAPLRSGLQTRRLAAEAFHAGRWREASDLYEAVYIADPDHSLPGSRVQWAQALLNQARHAEARELFVLAARLGPSGDRAPALYNAACCAALAGDKEGAFGLLRQAFEAGFNDRAGARADPDLASLRDDPRFNEIVGG